MWINDLLIHPETSIRDALSTLNAGSKGIVLVVDDAGRLTDTITDGDIRRAIIAGCSPDSTVSELLVTKADRSPTVVHEGFDRPTLLDIMRGRSIRQVPILDAQDRPVDLVTLDELLAQDLPVQAVIMAGGFGKRLYPLTNDTPKPMLPVGDKPLIEHIVNKLRGAGIKDVSISTHFKAEKIRDHFEDGKRFGVNVSYVHEDQPLGTAGAIGLLENPAGPILITNGDILTGVNYRTLLEFHQLQKADLTVCVRRYELLVPYGVVECSDERITRLSEKPTLTFLVNAGIYIMEPRVHAMIPRNERLDMTELMETLLASGAKVVSFPIIEQWLDIGQHTDYAMAQEIARSEDAVETVG